MNDPYIEADVRVMRQVYPDYKEADGYFIFQGIRVYQKGKREEVEKREAKTVDEIAFGHSKIEVALPDKSREAIR